MKIVIYTQRVEIIESYHEIRDCADQNIAKFIRACGYLAVPISNVTQDMRELVETLNPVGIILTGGNSLVKYGGTAPERDETDKHLIKLALEKGIPLYGFCRGMQSIIDYFGGKLQKVEGHVAVKHEVKMEMGEREVNSFHKEAAIALPEPLKIVSTALDGVIESAMHENQLLYGTMWHPEREQPFNQSDIAMVQQLFGE